MEPLHRHDDKHLTIRLGSRQTDQADKILQRAWKSDLQVMGKANPVRPKHSHIYRLAIEAGLPLVLDRLRSMQSELPDGGK